MNKVKLFATISILSIAILIFPRQSDAGCLTGAAAGGIAGHFIGHHAILGAIGGCLAGSYLKHRENQHRYQYPDRDMGRDSNYYNR